MKNSIYFKKSNFIIFTLGIIIFFGSVFQGSYIYDGFHWGLVASNAQDLLNGKKPYKDFFVHYGFLTVFFQAVALKFYNSVYSLLILSAFSYSVSIIFLAKLVQKYFSINYVYLFVCVVLFMQPFIVYPWHTYFIFCTSIISLFFYLKKNFISLFLFGLFLQLGFLFSESYKIFSITIVLFSIIFVSLETKKFIKIFKKVLLILLGYISPFLLFLIYLNYNNLIDPWLEHSRIPSIFMNNLNYSLFDLILNFTTNYIFNSINIFTSSYYTLGLVINLLCIYFIFISVFKKEKKLDFTFIACFSLLLNFMLVFRHESFRFFCGPIIGILILFFFINNFKGITKYLSIILVLFIAIISNPFEKGSSNRNFLNNSIKISSYTEDKISKFKKMNFQKDTWQHLLKFTSILEKVDRKCKNIKYFYNATSDHHYYFISSDYFKLIQKIPGYSETSLKKYYDSLNYYYDNSIGKKLNSKVSERNIIILRENNSTNYLGINSFRINLENYYIINLPFSYNNKQKLLYIPNDCNLG